MKYILQHIILFVLLLQLTGCKSNKERAIEYNDQAIDMMVKLGGNYPTDSLLHMHSLLKKAIELDPNNERFYLNLAQNYNLRDMLDSAVIVMTNRWNSAKTSYNIPFWLGMHYNIKNDSIKADYFYNEAYKIYNFDNPDTTDIQVLLDKKYIEIFILDSVDYTSLENHPDADKYKNLINHLKETDIALSKTSLYEQSLINEQ